MDIRVNSEQVQVLKLVGPVAQAAEFILAEVKRQRETLMNSFWNSCDNVISPEPPAHGDRFLTKIRELKAAEGIVTSSLKKLEKQIKEKG